jgi:hypothetical protein
MPCPSCASRNQSEFPVEMIIHLTGLKNVTNPGVLLFPRLLVCLDCGFLQYKVPGSELRLLGTGSSKSECSTDDAAQLADLNRFCPTQPTRYF